MKVIVITHVFHNFKHYKPGTVIDNLSELDASLLVKLNLAHYSVEAPNKQEEDSRYTVEQYLQLPANEQKDHLRLLEIEPASKEPERITQYTEWLNNHV